MSHPGVQTVDDEADNNRSEISALSSRASQDVGDVSYNVNRWQEQDMEVFLEAWCAEVASAARRFAARELSQNLRPPDFDPQLSLPDLRSAIPNTSPSNSQDPIPTTTTPQSAWLPPTLR